MFKYFEKFYITPDEYNVRTSKTNRTYTKLRIFMKDT